MPNVEYRKLAYVNCPETIASLNEEALDPSQDIEALRNYLLPVVRQSFVTDEDIDWNQLTLILAQYYKQRAQITIQIYEISNQLQRTESRVLKEIGEIQTICFECAKYPCNRLKALDKRYRTKYHMSMLENLAFIQENGLDEFIRQQNERYRCSRCGKLRTVHQDYCIYCAQMNKASR